MIVFAHLFTTVDTKCTHLFSVSNIDVHNTYMLHSFWHNVCTYVFQITLKLKIMVKGVCYVKCRDSLELGVT